MIRIKGVPAAQPTRPVAIPLTTAAMNLLSIGAAYRGHRGRLPAGLAPPVFAVSRTGPIDPWIPLMFTITFGLSMDGLRGLPDSPASRRNSAAAATRAAPWPTGSPHRPAS